MAEDQQPTTSVENSPVCLTCNKKFANAKSLATHNRKFHNNSKVKSNDSENIEFPAILEELNKNYATDFNSSAFTKKMKRSDISAGSLCYRLTPRIDLCDVVEILTYFTDLSNREMSFLTDCEKIFLMELIREVNVLKVFDVIRDNTDMVRGIIKKIHLAT